MKQNIFEIRQRTEDLIAQALEIWKRSDMSEQLEGLDNDPVFRLIMSTLAYQANAHDADLEQLKTEILQEFEQQLVFDDAGKAMPATAVVKTALNRNVSSASVDSDAVFYLGADNRYPFEPLLSTRVYNVAVKQITQLDGRRWLISLDFGNFPVNNLRGLAFVVTNPMFHSVNASIADNGMELPLIAPWDYANLPLSSHFSLDNIVYNRSCGYSGLGGLESFTDYCAMDLFARQNIRYFVVDDMENFEDRTRLDIMFEFDGLSHGFVFNDNTFHLNVIILANVGHYSVTLSRTSPIARLAGNFGGTNKSKQFVQLLRPGVDQLYSDSDIMIRRVGADRFNQGRLTKLLFNLYTKYTSDLYAFQSVNIKENETIMASIRSAIGGLRNAQTKGSSAVSEGVYAVLKDKDRIDTSLELDYLATDGAAVNSMLKKEARFSTPHDFDAERTVQICDPSEGVDELHDKQALSQMKRYALATGGRIVTENDIKLFCQTELMARFGVVHDLIKSIRINRHHRIEGTFHTYEICMKINITNNIYTQRAFAAKESSVETYLQKMIEVRMSGIYPVRVELKLID